MNIGHLNVRQTEDLLFRQSERTRVVKLASYRLDEVLGTQKYKIFNRFVLDNNLCTQGLTLVFNTQEDLLVLFYLYHIIFAYTDYLMIHDFNGIISKYHTVTTTEFIVSFLRERFLILIGSLSTQTVYWGFSLTYNL